MARLCGQHTTTTVFELYYGELFLIKNATEAQSLKSVSVS